MKNILFILAISVVFNSCKEKQLNETKPPINDYLTINLKVLVLEDDFLEVYFAESIEEPYEAINKVSTMVRGDSLPQVVSFELPKRVYPFKLRIDLGSKGNESVIEIKEIELSTGPKTFKMSDSQIWKYFRLNEYLKSVDSKSQVIRLKKGEIYDPFILSVDLTNIIIDLFTDK